MRLLLDTHALIWWLAGNVCLPRTARDVIDDERNDVFVSAATVWEIATKHRIGKLQDVEAIAADAHGWIDEQGFQDLPVTVAHGQLAGSLPGPQKDPFDRMLMAQVIAEDLVLISNEKIFDAYGVKRLW